MKAVIDERETDQIVSPFLCQKRRSFDAVDEQTPVYVNRSLEFFRDEIPVFQKFSFDHTQNDTAVLREDHSFFVV